MSGLISGICGSILRQKTSLFTVKRPIYLAICVLLTSCSSPPKERIVSVSEKLQLANEWQDSVSFERSRTGIIFDCEEQTHTTCSRGLGFFVGNKGRLLTASHNVSTTNVTFLYWPDAKPEVIRATLLKRDSHRDLAELQTTATILGFEVDVDIWNPQDEVRISAYSMYSDRGFIFVRVPTTSVAYDGQRQLLSAALPEGCSGAPIIKQQKVVGLYNGYLTEPLNNNRSKMSNELSITFGKAVVLLPDRDGI